MSRLLGLGWDHAQWVQENRLKLPAVVQASDLSTGHLDGAGKVSANGAAISVNAKSALLKIS